MSTQRLQIEAAGRGQVKITLDDHEITNAVLSINITGDARDGWSTQIALMPSQLDLDIVTMIGIDLTDHDARVRYGALIEAASLISQSNIETAIPHIEDGYNKARDLFAKSLRDLAGMAVVS